MRFLFEKSEIPNVTAQIVIPAKAGIQRFIDMKKSNVWIPDRSIWE
jgi:hypothetical protein